MKRSAQLRIGISGWRYVGWRGKFYPKGLPQHRELEFASGTFNSVEINGSFYSLQRSSSYQRWYSDTPDDFVFSVKGARFITHMKKLRDVETPLANFFASGVLALRGKLGPILWQLPPNFGWDPERLTRFFKMLPRNTAQAAKLAKKHDDKLKTRAWMKIDPAAGPLRYAVEVRHPSFMVPEFFALLRKHKIAFVFADTAKKWPYAEDLTADFVYIRLHGDKELYVSGYNNKALVGQPHRALAQRKTAARCQNSHAPQSAGQTARRFRLLRQRRQSLRSVRCAKAGHASRTYVDNSLAVRMRHCSHLFAGPSPRSSLLSRQPKPVKRNRSLIPSRSTTNTRGLVKNAYLTFDQSIPLKAGNCCGACGARIFLMTFGLAISAASPSGVT